jgi:glycine cleavage system regulatory protein
MKKTYLLIASLVLIIASACNSKAEKERLIEKEMRDSIEAALSAKNAEVEMLFQQLNEIEENLSVVTSKYADVSKIKDKTGEVSVDTRTKITSQIQDINDLLAEQKQKINNLNSQLRKQKNTNKELTAFIEKLQTRISEQEEEIQLLTTELQKHKIVIENLNRNLDELNKQNQDKDERILKIEEEKNTAYYVIGEKKELLEKGIINRKGGFLGMGKRSVASSDSELANYTKIDIRRVPEIRLHGTKIKILTSHPSESYRLEPDTKRPTRLVITNPSLFWQKSKFLVIELD